MKKITMTTTRIMTGIMKHTLAFALVAVPCIALAQEPAMSGALKKASEILTAVEARQGFAMLKSIQFSNGEYRVEYYMQDGAEVRITYDGKTGQVKPDSSFPTVN